MSQRPASRRLQDQREQRGGHEMPGRVGEERIGVLLRLGNEQRGGLERRGGRGDVRRHVPRDAPGIERMKRRDGTTQAQAAEERVDVLLGVINQGALIQALADAREHRLHEQPLQQGLTAARGPDDGKMAIGGALRQQVLAKADALVRRRVG